MTEGDHRNTPEEVLAVVRRLGRIRTDPCSNEHSIVGAEIEYDGGWSGDGLVEPWEGLSFVNGTWGNLYPWAERSVYWAQRRVDVCFWAPCYPETAWAKLLWSAHNTMPVLRCDWHKRVNHPLQGKQGAGSKWPTMMVYLGQHPNAFIRVFRDSGVISRVVSCQQGVDDADWAQ